MCSSDLAVTYLAAAAVQRARERSSSPGAGAAIVWLGVLINIAVLIDAWATIDRGTFVHVGWLGGYYAPRTFRHCQHVVAVTPDIVRHLRDGGFPADRSHYIPTFATAQPATPVSRASLTTPEGVPLLLEIGRAHV